MQMLNTIKKHSLLWRIAMCALLFTPLQTLAKKPRLSRYTQGLNVPLINNVGSAKIPFKWYKSLLKSSKQQQGKKYIRIGEARYTATHTPKGMLVKGELLLEATGKGWHQIPVLYSHYPLSTAKLSKLTLTSSKRWDKKAPQPAYLLPSAHPSGTSALSVAHPGRYHLTLRFFIPRTPGPDPKVKLRFVQAASTHLKVLFPHANYRPSIQGGIGTQRTTASGKTILKTLLPYKSSGHTLTWWQTKRSAPEKKKKSKRQARVYAKSFSLLSVGQSGQELFFTVRYTIVHAPREQFRLEIPANLNIRQVQGIGIRDYRLFKAKDSSGKRILDVLLREPVSERYELSLLAEQRRTTQSFTLQLPRPLQVQRDTGHLGVEVVGNDEISLKAKGALIIDVQELPKTIIQGTTRPILRAYRYNKRPISWDVRVKTHKNISVPAASIDRAYYTQVNNEQGVVWMQATYQIRNTFKQFLTVKLPKGSKVRSAFVGKKPVKPAKDASGRLLIPLKRSGKSAGQAFWVNFVYSLKEKAFSGKSHHKYYLPSVDLWTSSVTWRLYVPEGRIFWESDLLGNEGVSGYLSWNKFTLASRGVGYNADIRTSNTAREQTKDSGGTLSIKIKLPRTGRSYKFTRYHLAPGTPTHLELQHRMPWKTTFGLALLLFAGLLMGFVICRAIMEKEWTGRETLGMVGGCILIALSLTQAGTFYHRVLIVGAGLGVCVEVVVLLLQFIDKKKTQEKAA